MEPVEDSEKSRRNSLQRSEELEIISNDLKNSSHDNNVQNSVENPVQVNTGNAELSKSPSNENKPKGRTRGNSFLDFFSNLFSSSKSSSLGDVKDDKKSEVPQTNTEPQNKMEKQGSNESTGSVSSTDSKKHKKHKKEKKEKKERRSRSNSLSEEPKSNGDKEFKDTNSQENPTPNNEVEPEKKVRKHRKSKKFDSMPPSVGKSVSEALGEQTNENEPTAHKHHKRKHHTHRAKKSRSKLQNFQEISTEGLSNLSEAAKDIESPKVLPKQIFDEEKEQLAIQRTRFHNPESKEALRKFFNLRRSNSTDTGTEETTDIFSVMSIEDAIQALTSLSFHDLFDTTIVNKKWRGHVFADPIFQKKVRIACERGLSEKYRADVWRLLTKSTISQYPEKASVDYRKLCETNGEFSDQIRRDIGRTFPNMILFMHQIVQQKLFNILNAYANYNTEIGYTQGMGFVAALFMLFMEEQDAFWALARLIQNESEFSQVWKPGLPGIGRCFFVLNSLLKSQLPKIHQHLTNIDVDMTAYATPWFLTMFITSVNDMESVCRFWDIFLFEGFYFIYVVAVSFIKLYEAQLLTKDFDDAIAFLSMKNANVDFKEVLKMANTQKDKLKPIIAKLNQEYVPETSKL